MTFVKHLVLDILSRHILAIFLTKTHSVFSVLHTVLCLPQFFIYLLWKRRLSYSAKICFLLYFAPNTFNN